MPAPQRGPLRLRDLVLFALRLLAVGAVQHHLIRQGRRFGTSIVAETDDAYETHHASTLVGYGADIVVPRLAFELAVL